MPAGPRRRPFDCPHCGNAVPAKALACPACGSDASSGWSDDADAWAGDLPGGYDGDDDDFDYEETLRREGLLDDGVPAAERVARARLTAVVVILVVCVLLWQILR